MCSYFNMALCRKKSYIRNIDFDDQVIPPENKPPEKIRIVDITGRKEELSTLRNFDSSQNVNNDVGQLSQWIEIKQVNTKMTQCVKCNKMFNSISELWTHDTECYMAILENSKENGQDIVDYEHWLERRKRLNFACPFCNLGDHTFSDFREHLETHENFPCCKVCGDKFDSVETANSHLIEAHQLDPWSDVRGCHVRTMARLRRASGAEDEDAHLDQTKELASDTDFEVDNDNNIFYNGKKDGYQCKKCQAYFTEEATSLVHPICVKPLSVYGKRYWLCPMVECATTFDTKAILHSHVAQHLEKRWQCRICSHRFSTASQARFHHKKHLTNSFRCTLCSVPFVSKAALKNHLKIGHN
ncbi:hypothetical protein HDE_08534 [Halotydeus destructor]|nr:hypothetical protein HDE_08534 [Halotydeus destructor]